jgi:radical SAM superfamily enzyme YgiQ (UPF0313 family)
MNIDKIKIGLVQINNSFSGQNYLPYSIGLLQAYAQAHCKNAEELVFSPFVYKRIDVDDVVNQLKDCDIVGFSTYVWNARLSLKVAERLKQMNERCLVVFGGPHVPDNAQDFMTKHRFIDLAVHGEGEHVFSLILENFKTKNWNDISSLSYFDSTNTFVTKSKIGRLRGLDEIPSPYLNGVFDLTKDLNPDERWIILWETNRGCPFSCTFCDWGSAVASKVNQFGLERLYKEVDWFSENKIEFIFCCDANYGILPRDLDITKYVAKVKKDTGYPHALSVQNTKNATERAYLTQKTLAVAGLNKGVTISMQSMDVPTLKNIKRANISLESFQELQRRFTKDKIETYSDMILGLPGETYDSFTDGINQIIANGQHNRIQFNNLSLLPNAEMGNPEYQKQYGMEYVISKIINIHGSLLEMEHESIQEMQELVVATNSMPKPEWVKTRAYCWVVGLLYFDKILQIPISILHDLTKIDHKKIFERFMTETKLPILSEIRQFFIDKAIDVQNGGEEYCNAPLWLNIWWPPDEYIFIKLVKENKIQQFYKECESLLITIINEEHVDIDIQIIRDAIALNGELLKLPNFDMDDGEIHELELQYSVYDYYQRIITSDLRILENKRTIYTIQKTLSNVFTWDDWYREVVWYGNKKGAYLYGNVNTEYELEGHY